MKRWIFFWAFALTTAIAWADPGDFTLGPLVLLIGLAYVALFVIFVLVLIGAPYWITVSRVARRIKRETGAGPPKRFWVVRWLVFMVLLIVSVVMIYWVIR